MCWCQQKSSISDLCSLLFNSYQQELPTRFKKEITKAAISTHDKEKVGVDGIERVLANIDGARHHQSGSSTTKVSKADLTLIFSEMGEGGEIPASRFIQMI